VFERGFADGGKRKVVFVLGMTPDLYDFDNFGVVSWRIAAPNGDIRILIVLSAGQYLCY
jgi:hypothetical protein